jgi:hypothetical protein
LEPQSIWRPSSTGASQHWRLPTQVRCPGSQALHNPPCRSRLGALPGKAIPAGHRPRRPGQNHAFQGDAEPIWTPSGIHPSSALIGDIAVWRAAYGINPQDPRPTGGTQLETLSALWKQRLDRHIAHSTDSSDNARADELQAAHTERRRWHDHSQRPHQQPERRPSGPSTRGR